jgi:hypothetical protein
MAGQDSTTDLIEIARSIRAIGDLLSNLPNDLSFMRDDTLANVGMTLDDLATRALVILRYEDAKEPQAPKGGES